MSWSLQANESNYAYISEQMRSGLRKNKKYEKELEGLLRYKNQHSQIAFLGLFMPGSLDITVK